MAKAGLGWADGGMTTRLGDVVDVVVVVVIDVPNRGNAACIGEALVVTVGSP